MIICNQNMLYYEPVMWVFRLIKRAYGVDLITNSQYTITVGPDENNTIRIDPHVYHDLFESKIYNSHHFFKSTTPEIRMSNGQIDYISTIFYFVNCIQEYSKPINELDKYGRFPFHNSIQDRYKILEKDHVRLLIEQLLYRIDTKLSLPSSKSRIFVSHDIDSVYGSLKFDGLNALKTGNIGQMLGVIRDTVLLKPAWFNMDKVASLENEYDIKACYYWIVSNGRSVDQIKNGDYDINAKKIQIQKSYLESLGNISGLHKSTMETTFTDERSKIDNTIHNRYHFLKMNVPQCWSDLQAHGIKTDASLSYSNNMGFRNSFGLPFKPFCLHRKREIDILEIPLNIMDGMFDIKDKKSSDLAFDKITNFIESNAADSVLSILWHNSELTDYTYSSSFSCYKKLLVYFYDSGYESVLPSQLLEEYK